MYVMENDGKLAGKVLSLLRIDKIIGLGLIFITLLLVYARKVGFQSLLSFVGSVVIIWEFLIPAFKRGRKYLFNNNYNFNPFISFDYLFSGWFYKKRFYSFFRNYVRTFYNC